MTQEYTEETIETKEEEILTQEEVQEIETLDGKTDAELTDLQVKNKKIYARMKKEQEEKKVLKEDNEKLKAEIMELKKDTTKEVEEEVVETKESDPIEFAKKVRLLSTLDDEEISYAQILSKGLGKEVDEVIISDDFKLWQTAHKDKIKQDKNNLNPSNKTERTEKEDEFFKKFSSNLPKGFEIK
jgi:hypothetical protein